MTRVLLLENPHADAGQIFADHNVEVERVSGALDENEWIEALHGFDMVGVRSKTRVTQRVIEANPQLQAIGAFCIGTNQIDLSTATSTVSPCSTLRIPTPVRLWNWRSV